MRLPQTPVGAFEADAPEVRHRRGAEVLSESLLEPPSAHTGVTRQARKRVRRLRMLLDERNDAGDGAGSQRVRGRREFVGELVALRKHEAADHEALELLAVQRGHRREALRASELVEQQPDVESQLRASGVVGG